MTQTSFRRGTMAPLMIHKRSTQPRDENTMPYSHSLWGLMLLFQALFYSSLAFSSAAKPAHHLWGSHRRTSSTHPLSSSHSSEVAIEDNVVKEEASSDFNESKRAIMVESALVVPVSQATAFDAFSDLTRQVDYSPWLRSVTYLNPPEHDIDRRGKDLGETRWTMAYMGVKFSWNSVVSRLERPHTLEWESTSGMKNYGSVNFVSIDDDNTEVTMRMTFVTPRLVAALFRRSSAIAHVVENRIIRTTLVNFRDAIAEETSSQ